jgi:aminoglycoside 6'-N-acetyltransferase
MGEVGGRVRGMLTCVRPATAADADLLVGWHADPEVARYWDGETFSRAEMLERLARPLVEACVIEDRAGRPIGYLQIHDEEANGDGGLDMFLVPEARGRGLGPDAARAVALHLLDERDWTRVTVDPYCWNEGAVRVWERAGFVAVGEGEPDDEHTAPWLLMEFRG